MDERLVYFDYGSIYDMPGSAVIDNDYLYYICFNNNKLVKYSLVHRKVETVYYIPVVKRKWWLYRGISIYNNKIFLIPNTENVISVFDVNTEKFCEINDEVFDEIREKEAKIRHILQDGINLWLVSAETMQIFVLNMKTNAIELIDLSDCNCTSEFGQAILYEEYIYILSRDEKSGIRIHRENKKAYEWKAGKEIFYGAIVDGNVYFASAKKDIGGVWKRNIDTGESELAFSIDDDREIEIYRYWNVKVYERKVFFLPHDAKQMLVYDIDNQKIDYIDAIEEALGDEKRLYDLIRYNEEYVVIPCCGKEIWVCSSELIKQNKICYREEINDFVKRRMTMGCIKENEELEISEIMKNFMPNVEDEEMVHRNLGNEIHRAMIM